MPSRTFTDALGIEWIVLQVSPAWTERRVRKERRISDIGPKPGQPDRRKTGSDRRRGLSDTGPRVKIDPSLAAGWLTFEGAGERRRLTPVPPNWLTMSDSELVQLLAKATVIAHRRRLIE
jgi:hypothetical protein